MCCDAESGEFLWGIDLVKEYGTTVPKWYAGQCPLIDMNNAILAPVGKDVLMMGVACDTGEVVWKTPNPRGWKMTHSSIVPMEHAGRRMYVYCASGGVVGVAASDGDSWKAGDVLWETSDWQVTFANVPSPVVVGNGHVLLAGGYGAGSMMIRVDETGDGQLGVETVWRLEKSKEFGSEQQTPLLYEGHVYGVLPKEAGAVAEQLICMDLRGGHVWASGREHRFGLGPYMIADGLLFAMNDEGVLTMAEATAEAFRPLATARVLPDGHETWAPMAIADGRLLVRDLKSLVCLDVRKPKEE
jgi:outer membrane protein assembly factor BamB